MADCDPQTLVDDAKCIESCMPPGMQMSVLIALFCEIAANGGGGGGGGSGTVTSFSSGNLSPLFTTSVATPTTTPALSFTLSTQTANTYFAGPTGGGAAAPTFRAVNTADLGTGVADNTTFLRGDLTWQSPAAAGAQSANLIYAGPATGAPATPSFRSLVDADFLTTLTPQISKLGLGRAIHATIPLHVENPTATILTAAGAAFVTTGNTGFGAGLSLNATSFTNGDNWIIYSGGASNNAGPGSFGLYSQNAGVERMTLDTSGNMVLGNGGLTIIGTSALSFSARSRIISGADGAISLRNNANTAFSTLACGKVTSDDALAVVHLTNVSFGASLILDSTSHTSGRNWIVYSGSAADPAGAGAFAVYDVTAAADRMRITTAGNMEVVGGVFKCQGTDGIGGTFTVAATTTMTFKGGILTATT